MAKSDAADIITQRVPKIACAKCGRRLDVSKLEPFASVECPDCHTTLVVPAVLGQFLLTELLGAGGMGAVYKGMDQTLGRFVAIKVMKKQLGENQQLVESFFREARAAASLNHANIVQIYSCGQEKGQPYIVMELVGGGRLDQLMVDGQPVPESRALEVGMHVAEGLRAANEMGLVHGDIKPANILFDAHGVAKVVDFGLAQFVNLQQQRGEIWGTPYYISPEVARGQKADHRSDIYSLGGTLFHALTGKPPFDGPTASDVVLARLKQQPPSVLDFNPNLQPSTAALIARMLEVDPHTRYPTSASLMADIKDALYAAREADKLREAPKTRPPETMSLRTIGFVAGLVVVMLLALVFWLVHVGGVQVGTADLGTGVVAATSGPAETNDVDNAAANATNDAAAAAAALKNINFFKGNGEQFILAAVKALTGPKPMDMYEQLDALCNQLQPQSSRAMWIRLLQVVPCWIERRDHGATDLLNGIVAIDINQKATHPAYMPQVLAQFMLGKIDDGEVNFKSEPWPSWYRDLVTFYYGAREFSRGDLENSSTILAAYVAIPTNSPAWVYAFKPLAQEWLDQIAAWRDLRNESAELVAARQATAARESMERFQAKVQPILQTQIAVEIARLRDAERRDAAQRELARNLAYHEQVQKEIDRIDEVLTQNVPVIISQKDFRKAMQTLFKLQAELKTADAKEIAQNIHDGYQRMDDLKTYLIERLEAEPYRQDSQDLDGDAVGASSQGVRISLGGRGIVVKPWDQVGVKTMLQMANYYVTNTKGVDVKQQADEFVTIAVFCYFNGGFDLATQYADKARKMDMTLAPAIRKLMPDIMTD